MRDKFLGTKPYPVPILSMYFDFWLTQVKRFA